jgi:hypothetical protein
LCLISIASFGSAQENLENETNTTPVFGLTAGTAFTGGNMFSGNSLFIQPSVIKPISSKFSLQAGTLFQTYTMFSAPKSENLNFGTSAFMSFYGMSAYKLNERITLYGGFMHTRSVLTSSDGSKFSGNTFFGGADYKLSNNSSIGIRFAYSKDSNPFLMFPSTNQSCLMPLFPGNNSFPLGF